MNMLIPSDGPDSVDITQVVESPTARRTELESLNIIARDNPRDEDQGKKRLDKSIQLDPDRYFYSIPRGRGASGLSFITGPSARLAEDVAIFYGNLRSLSHITGITDDYVVATGSSIDLQSNTSVTVEVRRKIRTSDGRRYSDDMIGVTSNAACSIALRNAVLKVVPQYFWYDAYSLAQKLSAGAEKPIEGRRKVAVKYMKSIGVGVQQLLDAVGRKSMDEVTEADLVILKGLVNSIKNSEISKEEAFPSISGIARLNEVVSGDSDKKTNGKEGIRAVRNDLRTAIKAAFLFVEDEGRGEQFLEGFNLPNIDAVDSILSVELLSKIRDTLIKPDNVKNGA